jgi:hypothetical protein
MLHYFRVNIVILITLSGVLSWLAFSFLVGCCSLMVVHEDEGFRSTLPVSNLTFVSFSAVTVSSSLHRIVAKCLTVSKNSRLNCSIWTG